MCANEPKDTESKPFKAGSGLIALARKHRRKRGGGNLYHIVIGLARCDFLQPFARCGHNFREQIIVFTAVFEHLVPCAATKRNEQNFNYNPCPRKIINTWKNNLYKR